MWKLVFTKQALKDARKLASAGLRQKVRNYSSFCETIPIKIRRPTKSWLAI